MTMGQNLWKEQSGWYETRKMNRKSWYKGNGPIKNKTVLILPTTAGSGLARKLKMVENDLRSE